MTREEAIKELQENHDILRNYDIAEEESNLMQALTMAIKALECDCDWAKMTYEVDSFPEGIIFRFSDGTIKRVQTVEQTEQEPTEDWYKKGFIDGFEQGHRDGQEQEPCTDAVSREAVLELAYDMSEIDGEHFAEPCMVVDVEEIQNLPSVTQKSGKWTLMYEPKNMAVCSECEKCAYMYQDKTSAFCPNCGAKMVEPKESEE